MYIDFLFYFSLCYLDLVDDFLSKLDIGTRIKKILV